MDREFAQQFAKEWLDAWNTHDLDRILSHYTEDFELTSLVITKITGEGSGKLKGKDAIGAYWAKALALNPNLNFKLIDVYTGVDSAVLAYEGHRGKSCEAFHFREDGLVYKSFAHYEQAVE
ncbi:MAG: nuclear transport factor 2 family protein [Gammaproteobacteria bacterium]|nr:nuclear transport factor 2 family protein [Gammaproteobacteria bacterium]MDH5694540.1 nuclear transport factor 2 family protein [Gammaproteobacteria bacterium]